MVALAIVIKVFKVMAIVTMRIMVFKGIFIMVIMVMLFVITMSE